MITSRKAQNIFGRISFYHKNFKEKLQKELDKFYWFHLPHSLDTHSPILTIPWLPLQRERVTEPPQTALHNWAWRWLLHEDFPWLHNVPPPLHTWLDSLKTQCHVWHHKCYSQSATTLAKWGRQSLGVMPGWRSEPPGLRSEAGSSKAWFFWL